MKFIKYRIGLLTLLIMISCTSQREYTLNFCTSLNKGIECEPSLTSFNVGDRVFVLFECNQPFIEKKVTGKFYYIEQNKKIELGSQGWTINPGDSYAYDYVDFTQPGKYEFEFLNDKGEILASKKLEVIN